MNRRLAGAPPGAVALSLTALLLLCCAGDDEAGSEEGAAGFEEVELTAPEATLSSQTRIYFPDDRGTLSAEPRALPPWSTPEEGARALIEAVIAGPRSEDLSPPLPDGTSLGSIHLSGSGLLYVDLLSTEHSRPPASGSRMELTTVYSLVDSVLLNIPEIQAVVLLWNGRQLPTFAGHVDTSLPLRADADLVARR